MNYTYDYPRPMVCTDIILIKTENNQDYILLIERRNDPYKNLWALPGGFVDENESLENAAKRELQEETMVDNIELEQFKSYGNLGRDPRGHTISVIFHAKVSNNIKVKAGDDAKNAGWFPLNKLPELAFDHNKIIREFTEHYKL